MSLWLILIWQFFNQISVKLNINFIYKISFLLVANGKKPAEESSEEDSSDEDEPPAKKGN